MKKQPRREPKSDAKQPPARPRGLRIVAGIFLLAIAALSGWAWGRYKNSSPPPAPTTAQPPTASASTSRPAAAAPAQVGLQKLIGRWQRHDGGYVLEIRDTKADGSLDAAYFNPRPINIAKAAATRDGAALQVFVELRDKNYPGSTYQLTYDPQSDQLSGVYFQAVARENFEVGFVRMK